MYDIINYYWGWRLSQFVQFMYISLNSYSGENLNIIFWIWNNWLIWSRYFWNYVPFNKLKKNVRMNSSLALITSYFSHCPVSVWHIKMKLLPVLKLNHKLSKSSKVLWLLDPCNFFEEIFSYRETLAKEFYRNICL